MDLTRSHQATWIGHLVFEPRLAYAAKIIGSTSRGIFLLRPEGRVLFVSYETVPGPLTVNLQTLPRSIRLEARPHQTALVSPSAISFASGYQIRLDGAAVWQPSPLPSLRVGQAARLEALRSLAILTLETRNADGLAPLLAGFFHLSGPPASSWHLPFERALAALSAGAGGGLLDAQKELEAILGLGRGLTPSGDDFIAGLLLALNRLDPGEQPAEARALSLNLVQAAKQRTSALSAALIEAASLGSADLRLLTAWDGLLSGTLPPREIFQQLSAYGSSSGIDALAGFCAASSWLNGSCLRQAQA